MEVRMNIFSISGHKIKVHSKLAKSMENPSNSMCNDRKEETRHKQTHKWIWDRHHYSVYSIYVYIYMEIGISEMPQTLIGQGRVRF